MSKSTQFVRSVSSELKFNLKCDPRGFALKLAPAILQNFTGGPLKQEEKPKNVLKWTV